MIQLIIHDCLNFSNSAKLSFDTNKLNINSILQNGEEKLNIKEAKKVYFDNGNEINMSNIQLLKSGDHIHISDGEILDSSHEVVNLCILGAGSVGKSAVTLRYIQGQFISEYEPTIEDAFSKNINIDGNSLMLEILDTAGQEDFVNLITTWMRDKDGFILVYAINNHRTFDDLTNFYNQLCEVYDESNVPPFIIVGNKCDLDTEYQKKYGWQSSNNNDDNNNNNDMDHFKNSFSSYNNLSSRQVTHEEAVKRAQQWNAVRYFETSAKYDFRIKDIFGHLVREIIAAKIRKQKKSRQQPKKPGFFSKFCSIL